MRIVVATDFSPAAVAAARSALQLAHRLGDTVLLVTAVDLPLQYHQDCGSSDARLFDAAVEQQHQGNMDRAVAALRAASRTRVEGVVVRGETVAAILALVDRGTRLV